MTTSQNIVLIPAYEPGQSLLELLRDLSANGYGYGYDHSRALSCGCDGNCDGSCGGGHSLSCGHACDTSIIVVDDGSGPDYAQIFDAARSFATVLTHKENRGKGAALKTGLSYIEKTYIDKPYNENSCNGESPIKERFDPDAVIVTMDADGQHRVADAMRICEVARSRPDALVLGGRSFTGKIPLRSRFGNAMTRLVYHLSTGLKVYDTQTGLRAFHIQLLPRMLGIPGERYEYEMNVLLELAKARTPIIEEEIETIYLDNNSSSHFDTVRDSWRVYKEILRFSASSLAGFLVDYAMYSALILTTGSLRLSNIGARVVSASVNYTLNRKFVFRSRCGILSSALSYFLLAAAILAGNTLVLEYLVGTLGIGRLFAKILTEILFFAISWSVQRSFIFRRGTEIQKGVVI